jgi:hypothetical protein
MVAVELAQLLEQQILAVVVVAVQVELVELLVVLELSSYLSQHLDMLLQLLVLQQ